MKRIYFLLIIVWMATCFSATLTWTKYKEITSDVTISSTDELIIEPGTILRFATGVKLTVYGQISAQGTLTDPVIFTALDRGDPQWGGIEINSLSGTNQFDYSKFFFMNAPASSGDGGMNIIGSDVTISNSVFRDNSGDMGGALKITGGTVDVNSSYFYYNGAPHGGGIYIYNNSINAPSTVSVSTCKFEYNDAWTSGGAIYVEDNENSANPMDLTISKCIMFDHYTGDGGGLFYENRGMMNLTFEKCIIYNNSADNGSAMYLSFMPHASGNIPSQKISNILAFRNGSFINGTVYIDTGSTQNPENIVFTNTTIAFNSVLAYKNTSKNTTGGLYMSSQGNYAKIANSIIWGNLANGEPSNFLINDPTSPLPDQVFWYCDLENYLGEQTNINSPPLFIRKPSVSEPGEFDIDRYDFHLRLQSPCIDAGDPNESCFEPNSSRVNMGAYGNTFEAAKGTYTTEYPAVNTDIMIADNTATILDFQGKTGTVAFQDLSMGINSEVYISNQQNTDSIIFYNIFTPAGKFDNSFVRIQTLDENTPVQNLVVKEIADINNTDMYNFMLTSTGTNSEVQVNNSTFFADSIPPNTTPFAIDIIDGSVINIDNSKFIDYEGGIRINPFPDPVKKQKASGRLSNNSISFEPTSSSKDTKAGKQIGIEISGANMNVEENEIEGGDEGIVMKAGSSGRITNNSISFEPTSSTKKGNIKKGIVISGNSDAYEVAENVFQNDDWENTNDIIGIEIDNSKAKIMYNTLYSGSYDSGPRTGVKLIYAQDSTSVINNTIYGGYEAFNNTPSGSKIDIVNNIFWTDDSTAVTAAVNDTTDLRFYNNCIMKGLPSGITGSNNFNIDPEIQLAWAGDFTLSSTSPCINAGRIIDGTHSFASAKTQYFYYGTSPDIGAEEFYQELKAPENISTSVSGSDFTFSWDAVDGFNEYVVYSSDDPYGTFTVETVTTNLSYTASLDNSKKFYYVVASNGSKSLFYTNNNSAKRSATKKQKIDLRTKAENFRINKRASR